MDHPKTRIKTPDSLRRGASQAAGAAKRTLDGEDRSGIIQGEGKGGRLRLLSDVDEYCLGGLVS